MFFLRELRGESLFIVIKKCVKVGGYTLKVLLLLLLRVCSEYVRGKMNTTQAEAEQLLKIALENPEAQFREGQWEAIDILANQHQKLLVVQRTGWGKSAVYFISAKIFRQRGLGLTIIISPL